MLICFIYLMPRVAALMILLYHAFPVERTVFFFSFICYLCIYLFHRELCRLCDSSRLASFLLFCIAEIIPEIFLKIKFSSESKRYLIWVRDKWTDSKRIWIQRYRNILDFRSGFRGSECQFCQKNGNRCGFVLMQTIWIVTDKLMFISRDEIKIMRKISFSKDV